MNREMVIKDFLQWLKDTKFYVICEPTEKYSDFPYEPTKQSIEALTDDYIHYMSMALDATDFKNWQRGIITQ